MSAITGLVDALADKQPTGNYLTSEQDPTVPKWAKQPQKPAYTAQEVGALPDTTHIPSTADDINAEPAGAVSRHNVSDAAHSDIRLLIQGLSERLSAVADSDDTTLDQLSEVVAYIKYNRDLISAITTDKVNVSDVIDNLTTNVANKPLSAAQGVALKALIDSITIPEALPNPNALTFTGSVSGSYDGSAPLEVAIPSGGGGITVTNTAAVGQTIKITAVDETGHPTEWEAVDMAEQVQPDWNQNDSTQPDYVKNKTHYYSVREIATFRPVNSTEQVLSVPFSDIPELVCVDINGQRFEGLSRNGSGYIGDYGTAGWPEGKGYGFYFKLDNSTKNTRCAVDTRRFGVRPNCILYGMYVDKKIPYYYLPRPTATTPGAVKAEPRNDLSTYEQCVIDDAGTVYSRKYAPAQVFSDLSRVNLNKLSYDGDHGIFTDSIAEEISSVSELVLPVHVWRIFYNGRFVAYLLESADGQIVKFTYYLGGPGGKPKVEVLHTPSIVLDSSTEGSTRRFKLTVDDHGTITATEVM